MLLNCVCSPIYERRFVKETIPDVNLRIWKVSRDESYGVCGRWRRTGGTGVAWLAARYFREFMPVPCGIFTARWSPFLSVPGGKSVKARMRGDRAP